MLKIVKRASPPCEPSKRPFPIGTYVALPDVGATPAGSDNGWTVYVLTYVAGGTGRLVNLGSGMHRTLKGSLTEAWIFSKGGRVIPNEDVKIEVRI